MEKKEKFADPRWTQPLTPQKVFRSDLTEEQFKKVHERLLKGLEEGRISKKDYDDFMSK